MTQNRLYADLASWWPLLSAPEDYEEEAGIYTDLLLGEAEIPVRSLLELGCGGGNNALFMKRRFDRLTLTDLSPGMLEQSRSLNPECEHHVADMRDVRLDATFDAVFVHDAICYMKTEEDLVAVIASTWRHCNPGGSVLLAPDYVKENFRAGTEEGGHDESDGATGRGLRYLAWVWDPDPDDTEYVTDYAYLLRERDGTVEAVHDRHVEGLFPRDTWLGLMRRQGFVVRTVPLEHSEVEPGVHEMFVAKRPKA